jgi:hypothetical protein
VGILAKKDFFRRFYELKYSDLSRLMKEELAYKLDVLEWPFIPTSFREYQEISQYVPSPENRGEIIEKRMQS